MKTILVYLAIAALIIPAQFGYTANYQIGNVGLGDGVDQVFSKLGQPEAVQVFGSEDENGYVGLLYFRGTDSLSIQVSDLPENSVSEMGVCGTSWNTNMPAKCGMSIVELQAILGQPDAIIDQTSRKKSIIENIEGSSEARKIVDHCVGDTKAQFFKNGISVEYDKANGRVKSIRIYDPFSKLKVKAGSL